MRRSLNAGVFARRRASTRTLRLERQALWERREPQAQREWQELRCPQAWPPAVEDATTRASSPSRQILRQLRPGSERSSSTNTCALAPTSFHRHFCVFADNGSVAPAAEYITGSSFPPVAAGRGRVRNRSVERRKVRSKNRNNGGYSNEDRIQIGRAHV